MRYQAERHFIIALHIVTLAWTVLAWDRAANGVVYSVLYNFNTQPGDGGAPDGALLKDGSKLYGMTTGTGNNGGGTLFQYDLNTGIQTTLLSYPAAPGDGKTPVDSLVQSGTLLYGCTNQGGAHNQGTVFSYNLANAAESVLYSFSGGLTDGAFPTGTPLLSGNQLYGTTTLGGSNSWGAIYKYDLGSASGKIVHSFAPNDNDAGDAVGSLIQVGSLFYGMSFVGGSGGTIYQFDPTTNSTKVLRDFAGPATDGYLPNGSLTASGTTLYGMTSAGGDNNWGELFQYDLSSNQYKILHSFAYGTADGRTPCESVVLSGSVLYGMTNDGGAYGYGTVFAYDLNTNAESILHSFDGQDGTYPRGSLIVSGNTLYGMTQGGGNTYLSAGVIFSLNVPEPATSGIIALSVLGVLRTRCRKGVI